MQHTTDCMRYGGQWANQPSNQPTPANVLKKRSCKEETEIQTLSEQEGACEDN